MSQALLCPSLWAHWLLKASCPGKLDSHPHFTDVKTGRHSAEVVRPIQDRNLLGGVVADRVLVTVRWRSKFQGLGTHGLRSGPMC